MEKNWIERKVIELGRKEINKLEDKYMSLIEKKSKWIR